MGSHPAEMPYRVQIGLALPNVPHGLKKCSDPASNPKAPSSCPIVLCRHGDERRTLVGRVILSRGGNSVKRVIARRLKSRIDEDHEITEWPDNARCGGAPDHVFGYRIEQDM